MFCPYHTLYSVSASQPVLHAAFGPGSGPIFLSSVACSGSEVTLVNCSHSTAGFQICSHFNDAGVRCNEQQCKNVVFNKYSGALVCIVTVSRKPPLVQLFSNRPAKSQIPLHFFLTVQISEHVYS